jgi:putative hemolysin
LLKELKVDARIAPGDLERIPASGPVIAVSNHPFGILDGTLLTQVLTRVRADVRVLTNHFLGELPELAPYCIFIDPFDRPGSRMTNGRALKQAIAHVRARGLLLIFPAGEVAHFDLKTRAIRDPEWMPTAARLIRLTGARALPIRVRGANGLGFQVLGMVHPRLRTAALPTELLNKRGKSVDILVGSPIESARLEAIPEDAEAIQYLRLRSELLARRGEAALVALPVSAPVSEAIPAGDLEREIQLLPTETLLEQNRDYCVYVSGAAQIPLVLREIGRLREITFRAAGEGSGLARDLDRFDPHYFHLFIWNRSRRELWAPIGSATCRGCSTNSDARGSIRLRCSGFTRCFLRSWGRRSNWADPSSGRSIRSSSRRFCCFGKALELTSAAVRNMRR